MKVLTIINSLNIGGAEKLVTELLPLLEKDGVDIDVLLINGSETSFYKKLKSSSINISHFGEANNVYNPINVLRLLKYIKKYDVIHVHLFPALYWTGLAKKISFSKTILIYTEHSTYNKRRNYLFRYIDRFIYKSYNKIVGITNLVKENLLKHLNFNEDKFVVINNGVNLESVRQAIPHNPSEIFDTHKEGAKYLIQVSSFRYPKNQALVIDALSDLPEDIHLILIGDGPDRFKCEEQVEKMNLRSRVHFMGIRSDVYEFLKMADLIILSSFYEGLSISCIEGMASGKPFIGSDVPGIRDVVKGAGILFDNDDKNQLVSIITGLLQNSSFYQEVVCACEKKATMFDIDVTKNNYINLYQNALNKSGLEIPNNL